MKDVYFFDVLFHSQIIRVVVASPCRARALPAASRLDTNDLEMELKQQICRVAWPDLTR